MKGVWERLAAAWRHLPQSTKLLLAGLLLVAAVSLWYVGFYLPAQGTTETPAVLPAPEETPKAIEAPPIPPLSQASGGPPAQPQAAQASTAPLPQAAPATPVPLPRPTPGSPPPNPFVPLVTTTPAAPTPPATEAPRPQPVPSGPPVRVSAGTPLPAPNLTTPTRTLPGTAGALPAPKVLAPTPKAEVPPAPEAAVTPLPPAGLVERPLPSEVPAPGPTALPAPGKGPLEAWVEAQGLRLMGTLLGPVSVAILESRAGYLVLPVGSPIPGSEAVIRRVEADRVVLALKDETLEIPLNAQAGGGQ